MRILLISFYFAPYNAVGAVRPTRMAECLEKLGHEVFVLTSDRQSIAVGLDSRLPEARIARTPWLNVNAPVELLLGRERVAGEGYAGAGGGSGIVAALGALYRSLLHVPDAQTGWRAPALRRGAEILRSAGPFDMIYASAPPFSGLMVAARLSRMTGLPWVAELRDLWTDNHHYRHGRLRHALDRRIEARVLASASALVTVSEPLAQTLRGRFLMPVEVVPNGYDEFHPLTAAASPTARQFELVYTGSIYPAYDLDTLFSALALLREERPHLRICFHGRNLGALRLRLQNSGFDDLFRISQTVPHEEALARQRAADALLFFGWRGAQGDGILTSKLFEYLGSRRPILAIGSAAADTGRMIGNSGSGFVSNDPHEIAGWLRSAIRARMTIGRAQDLPPEPVRQYSRDQQATKLDRFLRRLFADKVGGR